MSKRQEYTRLIATIVIAFLFGFSLRAQPAYPWSGEWDTYTEGYAEPYRVNSTEYRLSGVDITPRLEGNFSGIDVSVANLTASEGIDLGGTYRTTWPSSGSGSGQNTTGSYSIIAYNFNSTHYVAEYANGTTLYLDTDGDTVINYALGNLTLARTWQEKVLVKGYFLIDNTLIIYNYTILELDGTIRLLSSSNCDMLNNYNQGHEFTTITIKGGKWDGNEGNQATGRGFYFLAANGDTNIGKNLYIEHIYLYDIKDTAVEIDYLSRCSRFSDIEIRSGDGRCFDLYQVYDTMFERINMLTARKTNMYIYGGESCHFNQIYCGGMLACDETPGSVGLLYIYNHGNSFFSDIVIDSPHDIHGLMIAGDSHNNQFSNLRVTRAASSSSYDAIRILNTANHNEFSNVYIGQRYENDDSAYGWNYAIQELNTADYNIFSNVIATNYTTYYSIVGINSKVAHTISSSFVEGSTWNTVGDGYGWNLTANGNYTVTSITLPEGANHTIRIKVFGISWVTEADGMELELQARGSQSNEAFTAETISVTSKGSTTTNFAAGDRVYWTFTASDDADIDDLTAGDTIQIVIFHEAVDGANCATSAVFQTVIIEYV